MTPAQHCDECPNHPLDHALNRRRAHCGSRNEGLRHGARADLIGGPVCFAHHADRADKLRVSRGLRPDICQQPLAAWCAGMLSFASFAAASLYFGLAGRASCGCFGAVHVNPWLALGLDLVILTGLFIGRPDLRPLRVHPQRVLLDALRALANPVLTFAGLVGVALVVAALTFGSPRAALAHLRAERLSVTPQVVHLGLGAPNELRRIAVEVQNWTDQPITIIGGTNDCACCVIQELPVVIPAGEARSIRALASFPPAVVAFRRSVELLTNDSSVPRVGFRITGTCIEPTGEGD